MKWLQEFVQIAWLLLNLLEMNKSVYMCKATVSDTKLV